MAHLSLLDGAHQPDEVVRVNDISSAPSWQLIVIRHALNMDMIR
jgi:hypothetical protein